MKKFLFLTLTAMLFCSCGHKTLMEEQRTFQNNNWQRFDKQTFEIDVPSSDDCYNIFTILEIDTTQVRESTLPLVVNFYSPNSEHRMFRTIVNLRDINGNWLGEPNGAFRRYQHKARANFFFNVPGRHTLEINQGTSHYDLMCVHSLTVKIEKAEIVYPE